MLFPQNLYMYECPSTVIPSLLVQVLTASAIALGINAFSLVMYSVTFFAVLALVRAEWEIDAVLIIVYLMFWAQTLVFLRVGSQAQSVLRMLHPQRT